jgi:hypothetical protein
MVTGGIAFVASITCSNGARCEAVRGGSGLGHNNAHRLNDPSRLAGNPGMGHSLEMQSRISYLRRNRTNLLSDSEKIASNVSSRGLVGPIKPLDESRDSI